MRSGSRGETSCSAVLAGLYSVVAFRGRLGWQLCAGQDHDPKASGLLLQKVVGEPL